MKGFSYTKGIGWHSASSERPFPPIPREHRMGTNPAFILLPMKPKRRTRKKGSA